MRYGRATACAGVSLSVARGAVYALLGRNGAGKSSLVRCLLGQQRPSSGRAMLFGEDVWKARARLMARVGVVPEEPDAPPAMTARQIAGFCRRLYPSWDQAGVDRRLERFGVPPGVAFGRLSKGEKGEVMLAAALGHAPELLVLDDPRLESFVGFPAGTLRPPGPPGPGRRRAQGSLRGADRRARRPRNDRLPDDARPLGCGGNRDARGDSQGRTPRAGRGDGDAQGEVPAHPVRKRPHRGALGVRHGARRIRGCPREGPRLGHRCRRLQFRRVELRAIPDDRRRRGRRSLADVARGDLPRRRGGRRRAAR